MDEEQILTFNQHLYLCAKLMADRDLESCMLRLKLPRDIAEHIRDLPISHWLFFLNINRGLEVSLDLTKTQIENRIKNPNVKLYRLEQLLRK